jgi:ABC-type uncharacterized transport system involved in gliding motility auxiliary subunit
VKFLQGYAGAAGAILLVLAIVLSTVTPVAWVTLSIGGFGLLLMVASLVFNREPVIAALRGRRAREASASAGYALTVLGVVVLANFLATRHHRQFDMTENKEFSLSEQTIKVLEALPRDLTVTAFFREAEPSRQKLEDLLDQYRYHSRRLTVRFIDPDTHPGDVKRYGITEYGSIVVESGKQESRTNSPDEEALTNALIKVTKDRERTVYFTGGHGERGLEDNDRGGITLFKGELEKQHYTVKPLVLSQGVPADATAVIIAGPQKPLLDSEVKSIDDYLDRGGRVFDMQDPGPDPGLGPMLGKYGLAVRKDLIIDRVSQLLGGDVRIPMIPEDGYDTTHPITRTFRYQTFYPLASSIDVQTSLPEGVTVTALGRTAAFSWGETSEDQLKSGRITLDEGKDIKGPLTLAAAATKKAPPDPEKPGAAAAPPSPPETRLVVFGDSDFLSNSYFNASGNGDLALSVVAWLSEQEELVSIRPKTALARILILTRGEIFLYFWTLVLLGPVLVTAAGVAIWLRRRKL